MLNFEEYKNKLLQDPELKKRVGCIRSGISKNKKSIPRISK